MRLPKTLLGLTLLVACKVSLAQASTEISINELLPNPSGDEKIQEYIELYNPGKQAMDLGGWSLKDESDKTYTFPADSIIKAGGYLAVYRPVSKITLNNDKDTIFLLDQSGQEIDQVSYTKALAPDVSWARDAQGVFVASEMTPNLPNFSETAPPTEIDEKTPSDSEITSELKPDSSSSAQIDQAGFTRQTVVLSTLSVQGVKTPSTVQNNEKRLVNAGSATWLFLGLVSPILAGGYFRRRRRK